MRAFMEDSRGRGPGQRRIAPRPNGRLSLRAGLSSRATINQHSRESLLQELQLILRQLLALLQVLRLILRVQTDGAVEAALLESLCHLAPADDPLAGRDDAVRPLLLWLLPEHVLDRHQR